jgi:isopenicillin N synthase-like dioxygenase
MPEDAVAFINSCDDLIVGASEVIFSYARAIEREYELPGFVNKTMKVADNWTFRFLHYFGGRILAQPHADRGGFTLHLFETAGGGQCLGRDLTWRDWEIGDGKTIIFPGVGLQHITGGLAKALWHRVISPPGIIDRFAMVAFIDFEHTHRYADQRQRIADLPTGGTYNMPFDEFTALFDPV